MGRWPALALVPLAVASFAFQTAPAPKPAPKPGPSREILVSGHVTRDGAPVSRVRVSVLGRTSGGVSFSFGTADSGTVPDDPPRITAVTGADGGYELLADKTGEVNLRVETLDGRTTLVNRIVTVPDAEAHVLDVELTGVPVTGLVADRQTRKPIADANLDAFPIRGGANGFATARSGLDGHFTLEVQPGDYRLRASADDYAKVSTELTVTEACAPEVRIELDRGLTLYGHVLDPEGRPAPLVGVAGIPSEPGSRRLPQTVMGSADGWFRLVGLENKPYTLLAASADGSFAMRTGLSPGAQDLVLKLQPGGKARVKVVGSDGAPVEGARVSLYALGGTRVWNPMVGPDTDARGMVELELPAGNVELMSGLDRRHARSRVAVAPGATVAVRIELAEPTGRTAPPH